MKYFASALVAASSLLSLASAAAVDMPVRLAKRSFVPPASRIVRLEARETDTPVVYWQWNHPDQDCLYLSCGYVPKPEYDRKGRTGKWWRKVGPGPSIPL